jgi:endonuclease-3 related protein
VIEESKTELVRQFVATLFREWGIQNWWPADSAFEVIVGAILTQNTAWTNVELALANLRSAGMLTASGIRTIPDPDLESLIRPAGFFRQKARSLKTFVAYLDERYEGTLERMLARPTTELRAELLRLRGIGRETADSILLYAGQHEIFVVDAYARRILERHQVIARSATYEEIRLLFEAALTPAASANLLSETTKIEAGVLKKPPGAFHLPSTMSQVPRSQQAQVLNDAHALVVAVGKSLCQARRVRCEECPLATFLKEPVRLTPSTRRGKH